MAEWLYEDGIGERRAALVQHGAIIEARIERDSDGPRVGSVQPGRLISRRERMARLDSGQDLFLGRDCGLSDGSACLLRITRESIPERDLVKLPRAELVVDDAPVVAGLSLRERIDSSGIAVRMVSPVGDDSLEQAGWSELLDAAATGVHPFEGGVLRLALTPAMAVFDVDGSLPAVDLAMAGAKATARVCRLFDITGNIVIDLPTIRRRDLRAQIGDTFDAALGDGPETQRMPIDPLGLLHVSRPRRRASLAERLLFAPVESAALALLRRAERSVGAGPITLSAHPAVTGWLSARPALGDILARRSGRSVILQPDGARAMAAGDVH